MQTQFPSISKGNKATFSKKSIGGKKCKSKCQCEA